ncbi:MAG: hypothetical protein B7Z37_06750 [Verrucomicrobia bacterium 12-59-8]|nr:MAG: hypothetical protein B7Z37_06750 [Verrucomicrobia bacterium 12-59-8]
MQTPPDIPIAEKKTKLSVEAARLQLEQALKAEEKDADAEAEVAQKRAINAYTGASILLPSEVSAAE